MVWCPATISEHLMCSKERLSITVGRQNTSILKQKLLFITIVDCRDVYYKHVPNFRMHQHSIQKILNYWIYFWEFLWNCGQRMPDSDAGGRNKNQEYSSKFIRQILLQETLRKTSPFLHWINIPPQNWSVGLFCEMFYFFHSQHSSGAGGASWNDFRGVLGRWAISGTVNGRTVARDTHQWARPDFRCGRGETTISNVKQKSFDLRKLIDPLIG